MKVGWIRSRLSLPCLLISASISAQPSPVVLVREAEIAAFPLAAEALGNTRANEAVEIRPEISGAVVEIHFDDGQFVQTGDVLLRLESSEPLAQLAAARAALVDSESQFRRATELFRTRVVSESQLQQLEAQRDADQAAVNATQARLDHTVIRAPFAGQLGLRRVSLGAVVSSDTVITTLDDISSVKLDFNVPEVFLSRLERGLTVTAYSVAWPDTRFAGVVDSIDSRIDPVSRTIIVRARLPNPDRKLRPGMFLTVTLLKEDVLALMIPEEAIVPERSRQFVFVVGPGQVVERREIRSGRRRPGEVEVLEGLAPGELVITEGTQKVRPGVTVTIAGTAG